MWLFPGCALCIFSQGRTKAASRKHRGPWRKIFVVFSVLIAFLFKDFCGIWYFPLWVLSSVNAITKTVICWRTSAFQGSLVWEKSQGHERKGQLSTKRSHVKHITPTASYWMHWAHNVLLALKCSFHVYLVHFHLASFSFVFVAERSSGKCDVKNSAKLQEPSSTVRGKNCHRFLHQMSNLADTINNWKQLKQTRVPGRDQLVPQRTITEDDACVDYCAEKKRNFVMMFVQQTIHCD